MTDQSASYLQSGKFIASAGRPLDDEVDEELLALPLLPLPVVELGVVVVVLVLPIWVVVLSRTCLVAASQHLSWLMVAEGVVVVLEV